MHNDSAPNIPLALKQALSAEGWSTKRLASEAGVGESAARQWLLGISPPSGPRLECLRAKMPSLCALLDAQHEAYREQWTSNVA